MIIVDRMVIVENKIIPFKGYKALTLGNFIFTKNKSKLNDVDINHEAIHYKQQKELYFVGFLIVYIIEFAIRLLLNGFKWHEAYRNISLEAEAYSYQKISNYLEIRKPYQWTKFIR